MTFHLVKQIKVHKNAIMAHMDSEHCIPHLIYSLKPVDTRSKTSRESLRETKKC